MTASSGLSCASKSHEEISSCDWEFSLQMHLQQDRKKWKILESFSLYIVGCLLTEMNFWLGEAFMKEKFQGLQGNYVRS